MADIEKLDDHRKGDRLTAHLGLAAAKEGQPVGNCLTSEQLADVAAGCCTPQERQAALAHFISCRKCYEAWVAVSFSLAALETGSGTRRGGTLFSLRNLSYLGSAFAVAASIVVFFHLGGGPYKKSMVEPSTDNKAEQVQLSVPQEDAIRSQPEQSVRPEPAVPPAEVEKRMVPAAPAPRTKLKTEEGMAEQPEAAATARKESVAEKTADMAAAEGKAPVSAAEWLSRVRDACRDKSYQDNQAWNRLAGEGETIATSDPLLRARLSQVQAIITAQNIPGGPEEQCRRILRLLAGEGTSE